MSESRAKRAGEILGAQLANIALILDPQAIVLAGDLLKSDGPLWHHAMRSFRRHNLPELVDRIQILSAQLGPYGAAFGAAYRSFQLMFPIEPMAK